jgi:hypothetical protein
MLGVAPTIADAIIEQLSKPRDKAVDAGESAAAFKLIMIAKVERLQVLQLAMFCHVHMMCRQHCAPHPFCAHHSSIHTPSPQCWTTCPPTR